MEVVERVEPRPQLHDPEGTDDRSADGQELEKKHDRLPAPDLRRDDVVHEDEAQEEGERLGDEGAVEFDAPWIRNLGHEDAGQEQEQRHDRTESRTT